MGFWTKLLKRLALYGLVIVIVVGFVVVTRCGRGDDVVPAPPITRR